MKHSTPKRAEISRLSGQLGNLNFPVGHHFAEIFKWTVTLSYGT
jgi:hypothetical protein